MKSLGCLAFGCLALFAVPAVQALERGDISFYLSFEQSLQPEIAAGDTEIRCSVGKPDAACGRNQSGTDWQSVLQKCTQENKKSRTSNPRRCRLIRRASAAGQ